MSVFSELSDEYKKRSLIYSRKAKIYLFSFFSSIVVSILLLILVPVTLSEIRIERSTLQGQIELLETEIAIIESNIEGFLAEDVDFLRSAWVPAAIDGINNVYWGGHFSSSNNNQSAIIVGEQGFLALSDDCGVTWETFSTDVTGNLLDIEFLGDQFFGRALVAGRDGVLLEVTEGVSPHIEKVILDEDRDFRDIFRFGRTLYVSGSSGVVLQSDGNIEDWADLSIPTESTIYDMDYHPTAGLIAVGEDGLIAVRRPSSESWIVLESVLMQDVQDVVFIDATSALVSGRGGFMAFLNVEGVTLGPGIDLTRERIIDIELTDQEIIVSGDAGFLAVADLNTLAFSRIPTSQSNFRQITVQERTAYVPTLDGDIILVDLETMEHRTIVTPATVNLSRVVSRDAALSCAFVYGNDGHVLYPSSALAEYLSALSVDNYSNIRDFYENQLDTKLRQASQYFDVSQEINLAQSAQRRVDALYELVNESSSAGQARLGFDDWFRIIGYTSLIPFLALMFLVLGFLRNRFFFCEATQREFLKSSDALLLADVSETHDEKVQLLARIFGADGAGIGSDVPISDVMNFLRPNQES